MSSDAEAQKAISTLNGTSFMGRNIIVSEAKPQERRERGTRDRGGFGSRRPGGRR
jgi:RNA recognition motif-containing protein